MRLFGSSMACCFSCGKKSSKDKDPLSPSCIKTNLLSEDAQKQHKRCRLKGWPLLGNRRKINREASEVEDHDRASKWKDFLSFLRNLRAKARKMNCVKQPSRPGFNYDPLSYAMNFDEGCWQCDLDGQGFIHSMRFSRPAVVQNESFRGQESETVKNYLAEWNKALPFRRSSMSVWERRKACQPPALDLRMAQVWRPVYMDV